MTADPKPKVSKVSEESRLWSALCYLVPLAGGILLYVFRQDDNYSRYHAMQSIVFWIVYIAVVIVASVLALVPGLRFLPSLVLVVSFLIALFLGWKAWSGERYRLPYVGPVAEKYA